MDDNAGYYPISGEIRGRTNPYPLIMDAACPLVYVPDAALM